MMNLKILYLIMISGIGIFATTTTLLLLQNSSLQQKIDSFNSNAMNTSSILNEYENQFGNITLGYNPPPVSLNGRLYLCECIGGINTNLEPNSTYTIKTGHDYLIQAHLTRKHDVKPSLLYYVCGIEILNSTGKLVVYGWGDMVLTPKHDSSNCALQWVPTEPGNYTAQAFAPQDEIGSDPRMFPLPTIHMRVLP